MVSDEQNADFESEQSKAFKVIELTTVTDQSLEDALNDGSNRGWELHDIRFVMRDASRRPAMAFLIFRRSASSAA